ncbi:unnamed protein product [Ilex paraguariensis]|uniref:Uncharacterized protein n=1 Tax=Ilex paraguariensis TaxID=185542 RepID=A0ABC8RSU2_9AQUA
MKALVADELLKHSDVDVKVAVASCISEITRITAPDAPYDDDQMKVPRIVSFDSFSYNFLLFPFFVNFISMATQDVFQLIVSSFENLSDKSSRSNDKRALILETLAKVRSCVVMLDLECDGLIVEMFQHFLKAIRDYHPETVFSSMETIMTLVLEESEDIPFELLMPILASVKKDNEEVLPIARKLGERVLENCGVKLKSVLTQAVRSLGASLDDYSKVVTSLCEGTIGTVECNGDIFIGEQLDNNLAKASSAEAVQDDESKLATAASDEEAQVARERVKDEACPDEVDPSAERSPKPIMSNGIAETANDGTLMDPESLKKPEDGHLANPSVDVSEVSRADTDDSEAGKSVKSESKPEQTVKRRGKKPNSLIKSTDPLDSSHIDSEKEAEILEDGRSKVVPSSLGGDPSVEADEHPKSDKESDVQLTSPKALENEAMNVASPSPSGSLLGEGRRKKPGRPKKESLIQEAAPSTDVVSKKESEVASGSVVKPNKRSGKKATAVNYEDRIPMVVEITQNEGGTTSDSEAKPLEQSGKKVDASKVIENKSSSKKKEDGKRCGRRKETVEKDETKSSPKDDVKEMNSSPKSATKSAKHESHFEETPKTNPKRKRTPGKDQASETLEYGENLVGSNVKVWWPIDRKFYKGIIDSFDSVNKKHKVLYADGDKEILNLSKERWQFVQGDSVSDGEHATEDPSQDASSDTHKRKKAKMHSEPSAKLEKMEVSPKRVGAASSTKSKGTSAKSGHKSRDDGKIDSKSKDVDGGTPNTTTKSKQDTPKTLTKSKGKTPQSSNKSSANGMGKVKPSSSKRKETEVMKAKSPGSVKKLRKSEG